MTERRVAFCDIETTGAQNLYNQTPREQFHLGQWAWGRDGEPQVTTDFDEFMDVVESADLTVWHNGINYDLISIYGAESTRPLELALQGKVLDTYVWYTQRNRVPLKYTTRSGTSASTYQDGKQKPELVRRFLGLDNLTFQHNLPGKMGNLKELAKQYNPKGTPVNDLNFALIPQDDPDFLEYAKQDIVALQGLASYLMGQGPIRAYEWREMLVWSINAQMSRNGFTVDKEAAQARVDELEAEKDHYMGWLVKEFDMPTTSAQPWKSNLGKVAILQAFESFGITPTDNPAWEKTPKGAPSFGGKVLVAVSEGTEAEPLGRALQTLQSQRALAYLALETTHNDGKAHPQMEALQRSGRFSMSNPSLPIWTAHGPGAVEKRYYIASPGCKLIEMDLSNADQRIVAALSGDREYAKRFEGDADGHEITGRLMFGDEQYEATMLPGWETDDKIRKANPSRQIAKALSHAFAYGAGAKTLARTARKDKAVAHLSDAELLELANIFVSAMNAAYPRNKEWRARVARQGESGWITNTFDRKMPVDIERAWTQSSGLLGQSGTREILMEGLIRIAHERLDVIKCFVASVHDAVVWDIPEKDLDWMVPYIVSRMEMTYDPGYSGSQPIWFPMTPGKPADNWFSAGH